MDAVYFPHVHMDANLIIVIASRYSKKISKRTKSNTVSALATLLLLSYSKLLITVIGALSITRLYFPNGELSHPVWLLDANIPYSSRKLILLLIMSILVVIGYIIPFTLLVSFGFLMQAKSDQRMFRWTNKITPFLDAFYAPYTKIYRSWPGILLFVRLSIYLASAFYSYGDNMFKLAFIAANIFSLFAIRVVFNIKYNIVSIYSKKKLDFLELFFLSNLIIFTLSTSYFKSTNMGEIMKQQILAVVMLGSTFLITVGIIIYQLSETLLQNCSVVKRVTKFLRASHATGNVNSTTEMESMHVEAPSVTHSTVELEVMSGDELREPLLTS